MTGRRRRTREVSSPARVRGVQISPDSVSPEPYSELFGGGEVLGKGAATYLAGIKAICCVGTWSIVTKPSS